MGRARQISPLARIERRLPAWAYARGGTVPYLYEFLRFALKPAWVCLFGGAMLALLVGTYLFYPADAAIARYDDLALKHRERA